MASHVVKEGEHLTGICVKHGFSDMRYVYDHPLNASLKSMRPNPNQLVAGDVVEIPPLRSRVVGCATNGRHLFRVKQPMVDLHLVLRGARGEPLKDQPYTLQFAEISLTGTTDGDGALKHLVPAAADAGLLRLERIGIEMPIQVGHLDPHVNGEDQSHVVSGAQARLRNLGYDCGVVDGNLGPLTTAAIARFQRHEMGRDEPDGALDAETLDALLDKHGC
jgi:hypothetical protein